MDGQESVGSPLSESKPTNAGRGSDIVWGGLVNYATSMVARKGQTGLRTCLSDQLPDVAGLNREKGEEPAVT